MDLDSVITFKRVLNEENITSADKMLLSSAINNHNIDINLSLRQNLNLINKTGISLEELFLYLKEFLGNEVSYIDVPIYMLLLEKSMLWDLLLNAYKRSVLSEESVLAIGQTVFEYLDSKCDDSNDELIIFLNNLLSVRRPENYTLFQKSFSVEPFVYSNIDHIYNGDISVIKTLLVTLISFGYIDLKLLNLTVGDSYVESFIKELLEHELFTYVKIFINPKTVNEDLAVSIKDVIANYAQSKEKSRSLERLVISANDKLDAIINSQQTINRH